MSSRTFSVSAAKLERTAKLITARSLVHLTRHSSRKLMGTPEDMLVKMSSTCKTGIFFFFKRKRNCLRDGAVKADQEDEGGQSMLRLLVVGVLLYLAVFSRRWRNRTPHNMCLYLSYCNIASRRY